MTIARMAPVFGCCGLGIEDQKREKKHPHMLLCTASAGEWKEWCTITGGPEVSGEN